MESARKVILLVAALVLVAVALTEFRKKKVLADTTVADVESAIEALDPVDSRCRGDTSGRRRSETLADLRIRALRPRQIRRLPRGGADLTTVTLRVR